MLMLKERAGRSVLTSRYCRANQMKLPRRTRACTCNNFRVDKTTVGEKKVKKESRKAEGRIRSEMVVYTPAFEVR